MIPAYPLQWPHGWKRATSRKRAAFGMGSFVAYAGGGGYNQKRELSVMDGIARILGELGRLGIGRDDIVISTNLRLRLDGLPRSDQAAPADPGVAVYWTEKSGATRCMAIDRYDRVADNLAAVAATIEAMRAIERHGGAEILNRAFTGFTALPAPGKRDWRVVLELDGDTSLSAAQANYRRLAAQCHPDKPGGSHDAMTELNTAWKQAQTHLKDASAHG